MANAIIGNLSAEIISLFSLPYAAEAPILIGPNNIDHMNLKNPADYTKYGKDIAAIIALPDYVGVSSKDGSIEYVKEYGTDGEFLKVAVRVSNNDVLFVRSLYGVNRSKIYKFIESGTLVQISDKDRLT